MGMDTRQECRTEFHIPESDKDMGQGFGIRMDIREREFGIDIRIGKGMGIRTDILGLEFGIDTGTGTGIGIHIGRGKDMGRDMDNHKHKCNLDILCSRHKNPAKQYTNHCVEDIHPKVHHRYYTYPENLHIRCKFEP